MFRPPFLARVAAGAAVYALEETRRLPTAAMNFPITAISQILQTSMHVQQFVTSLALKGDAVFDRLSHTTQEQPEWATFDEDLTDQQTGGNEFAAWASRFDLYTADEPASGNGHHNGSDSTAQRAGSDEKPATAVDTADAPSESEEPQLSVVPEAEVVEAEAPEPEAAEPEAAEPEAAEPEAAEPEAAEPEVDEPEVAKRYDYATMTLAQLRARLRMLTVEDLQALLDYEQRTQARAAFVTMLTNRIATVQAQ
ncbi:lipid droplet-associated protein [Nocardia farcinica]|uniref:lipid droplet-associated protein n=1 Tax=Nocardia farcinica TaxID=37329 RepID=UPI001895A14C|nr:lipid droplet-associated protein [Nocardia farcinica]MBF6584497.1 lipid droplet-associated protein [Nocardia farcinica]